MALKFAENEYRAIGLYLALNFAERNNRITDAASLLDIKSILEENYTDGITAIREAYFEGEEIAGVFEDKVSPQLTKRLKFKITDSEITYSLLNPNQVESFSESDLDLEFAAAKKPKNCKKGIPCGGSCLRAIQPSGKPTQCRKPPSAVAKKKVAEVKKRETKKPKSSGTSDTGSTKLAGTGKIPAKKKITEVKKAGGDGEVNKNKTANTDGQDWNKIDRKPKSSMSSEDAIVSIPAGKYQRELNGKPIKIEVGEVDYSGQQSVAIQGVPKIYTKDNYERETARLVDHYTSPMGGTKNELGDAYEMRSRSPIKSQKDFDKEFDEAYIKLDKKYNSQGTTEIYRVRRALGDRVTREEFDKYVYDLMGRDKFTLEGGSLKNMAETTFDKLADSFQTNLDGYRTYVRRAD